MLNEKNIFTNEFKKVEIENVVKEINKNGYFEFENALTNDAVSKIENDGKTKLDINQNKINGVYWEKQYFFTNLLATSKTFYDFVTSEFVLNTCEKYLGNSFRLKALRYYETYGDKHMQWHTDNKTDKNIANIPGLIFIFYVSDVENGQFQYIKGSHNWSGKKGYSDYSDDFINKNYNDKIKNFKLPKGSLIIYNTYGIHRAEPVYKKNFIRKSVFFQVDSGIDNSERIILNTKFVNKMNDKIQMFFGFGKTSDYPIYPNSSLNTLPLNKSLFYDLIKYVIYRFCKSIFNYLPKFIQRVIKKYV
mgnify:CR=1 FL=1